MSADDSPRINVVGTTGAGKTTLGRELARRLRTKEELWNDNRERWAAVFGKDSLYAWVLKTYWRRKREYPALLQRPEYQHLQVVRLKSPREAEGWMEKEGMPP